MIFKLKFWLACQIGNIGVDQARPIDPSGSVGQRELNQVAVTINDEEQLHQALRKASAAMGEKVFAGLFFETGNLRNIRKCLGIVALL